MTPGRIAALRILSVTLCVILVVDSANGAPQEEGWVTHHVAISPSLDTVVLGTMHAEKGTSWILIRDAQRIVERQRLPFPYGPVRDVSFSRDGTKCVAPTSRGNIRLFETQPAQMLQDLEGPRGLGICVAMSPDGRLVASGVDGVLRLVETELGRELWKVERKDPMRAIEFLADDMQFVTASQLGLLELWKIDGQRQLVAESLPATSDLAVSVDGQSLASVHRNGELRLWNLAAKRLNWTALVDGGRAYSVTFAADGKQVAASGAAANIAIWNCEDGQRTATLETERPQIAVRWSADRLMGADYDGTSRSWRQTKNSDGVLEWRAEAR